MAVSLLYEQSIKTERGEVFAAQVNVKCTAYTSGTYFIELYDVTNGASLDKEVLEEQTSGWVCLQVSARVPVDCVEVSARYGMEDAGADDTVAYFAKYRCQRGGAVRVAE